MSLYGGLKYCMCHTVEIKYASERQYGTQNAIKSYVCTYRCKGLARHSTYRICCTTWKDAVLCRCGGGSPMTPFMMSHPFSAEKFFVIGMSWGSWKILTLRPSARSLFTSCLNVSVFFLQSFHSSLRSSESVAKIELDFHFLSNPANLRGSESASAAILSIASYSKWHSCRQGWKVGSESLLTNRCWRPLFSIIVPTVETIQRNLPWIHQL